MDEAGDAGSTLVDSSDSDSDGDEIYEQELASIDEWLSQTDTDNEQKDIQIASYFEKAAIISPALNDAQIDLVQFASYSGHIGVVRTLFESGHVTTVCDPLSRETTALHMAATSELVHFFLAKGYCVNAVDDRGWTPLWHAVERGLVDVVRTLLAVGADVGTTDDDGNTALHFSAQEGHGDITRCLIENGASANVGDNECNTALHLAAYNGHAEAVRVLLACGSNPDSVENVNGHAPLHIATDRDCVAALLAEHADVNIRDGRGITPLMVASLHGRIDVATELLKCNADVNCEGTEGETALCYASQEGHADLVRLLVEHGARVNYANSCPSALHVACGCEIGDVLLRNGADVNITDDQGMTPLWYAVVRGQLTLARLILDYGADVNSRNGNGATLLHYAAQNSSADMVQLLLDSGADVNAEGGVDNDESMPLHAAGTEDIALALVQAGAKINAADSKGRSPLWHSVIRNLNDVSNVLLKCGADVRTTDADGNTLLHYASHNGQIESAKTLAINGADINAKAGPLRDSALHVAIEPEIVHFLVAHGAETNATDVQGTTPLWHAAGRRLGRVVCALIDDGAEVNVANLADEKLLFYAVQSSSSEIVQTLLEKGANVNSLSGITCSTPLHVVTDAATASCLIRAGGDINARDASGKTPLWYAVSRKLYDVLEVILKAGADINSTDNDRATILHYCSQEGDVEAAATLIKFDANVNAKTHPGHTPLHLAKSREIVRLLHLSGAEVDAKDCLGGTPLWIAVAKNNRSVVQTLIDAGADVNSKNSDGDSVLCFGLQNRNCCTSEIAQMLVDHGADVNEYRENRRSPLHLAAENGLLSVVKSMLQHDARTDVVDHLGRTPLHTAVAFGKTDVVGCLIEHGSNVNFRMKSGSTPLHVAVSLTYEDIVTLLTKNGADINAFDDNRLCPIHVSSTANIVQTLLAAGADANVGDGKCMPPLLHHLESSDAALLLLMNGATCNARSLNGDTALILAAADGYLKTVELLLVCGADMFVKDKYNRTAKQRAAFNGHLHVVECLLEAQRSYDESYLLADMRENFNERSLNDDSAANDVGQSLETNDDGTLQTSAVQAASTCSAEDVCGMHPLHYFARAGAVQSARRCISLTRCVDARDMFGNTPLHEAAASGLEMCVLLVQHGASVNAQNIFGKSPLHVAVESDSVDVVKALLASNADIWLEDAWTNTPLHYMTMTQLTDYSVRHILIPQLQAFRTLSHKPNFLGISPWQHLRQYIPDLTSSRNKQLIYHRPSHDLLGNTELHRVLGGYGESKLFPASQHITELVQHLTSSANLSMNDRNVFGHTPMHVVRGRQAFRACQKAIDAAFYRNVDTYGRNFLHSLFIGGGLYWHLFGTANETETDRQYAQMLKYLERYVLDSECLTSLDVYGRVPLHYVIRSGCDDGFLVRRIEEISCAKNLLTTKKDIAGRTALHYAAICDSGLMYDRLRRTAERASVNDCMRLKDSYSIDIFRYVSEQADYLSRVNKCKEVCFKHSNKTVQQFHCVLQNAEDTKSIKAQYVTECRRLSNGAIVDPAKYVWTIWQNRQYIYDRYDSLDESPRSDSVCHAIQQTVGEVVDKLLKAVEQQDSCFRCRTVRAGSVYEGSKVDSLDEFDYTVRLELFSEICEPVVSAVCPVGYVLLRVKDSSTLSDEHLKRVRQYVDSSGLLDTRLIKLRFEVLVKRALSDDFDERLDIVILNKANYEFSPFNVGMTIKMRLMHPVGNSRSMMPLTHVISIDLVPAIQVDKWFSITRDFLTDSRVDDKCLVIFDQPQRKHPWVGWTKPHARLCFSREESQVIRKSPTVIRASYVVVKQIAKNFGDFPLFKSYVLKSAILHCIRDENRAGTQETRSADLVNEDQLLCWVQRIMKRLLCFVLQDYVPSVFVEGFKMPVCMFEPHFKFSHVRLFQLGLTYQDIVGKEFFKKTKCGEFDDSQLNMIAKAYIGAHLMYYSLTTDRKDFPLCFPPVNPIMERAF